MNDRFRETIDWPGAGWALAVWAAHFSVLWGASVVFPAQPAARWLALAATLAAFGALAWLWRRRAPRRTSVVALAIGLASAAIVFGAMPALIG